MKKLIIVLGAIGLLHFAATSTTPPYIESQKNPVKFPAPYGVSNEVKARYDRFAFITDWHYYTSLWRWDFTKKSRGQVDFTRMRDANIALGSDYDGSVTVPVKITGFPLLGEKVLTERFTKAEMKAAIGENVKTLSPQNLK